MVDQASGLLSTWVRGRRIKTVRPYIRGRVLDFGCGVGELAEMCSPESYLGVDIDQESLQIARRRRPHFCFASEATGHKHFDTIVALALLEHVPDPCSTLQELRSCGGPGCRIVLTVPHPSYYWLHAMLSHIGILSRNAHEEHQQAIDEDLIGILARETGMRIVEYRRFLMGANQLLVLEPNASSGDEVVE